MDADTDEKMTETSNDESEKPMMDNKTRSVLFFLKAK